MIDNSPERTYTEFPEEKRLKVKGFDGSIARKLRLSTQSFGKAKESSRKKIFRQSSILDLHASPGSATMGTTAKRRMKKTESRRFEPLAGGDSQEVFEFSDSVQIFRLQAVKGHSPPRPSQQKYSQQSLNPRSSSLTFYPRKQQQKALTQVPSKRTVSPEKEGGLTVSPLLLKTGAVELYKYYDSQVTDAVTEGLQGTSVEGRAYKMLPNNRRVVFEKKHNQFLKLKV